MKSSIKWYAKQLAKIGLTDEVIGHLTKEAIEMHKQEIIEATKYGNSFEQGDLRCETYYKNTYEKEN